MLTMKIACSTVLFKPRLPLEQLFEFLIKYEPHFRKIHKLETIFLPAMVKTHKSYDEEKIHFLSKYLSNKQIVLGKNRDYRKTVKYSKNTTLKCF